MDRVLVKYLLGMLVLVVGGGGEWYEISHPSNDPTVILKNVEVCELKDMCQCRFLCFEHSAEFERKKIRMNKHLISIETFEG